MKKRDIGLEILDGIQDIKRGRGRRHAVHAPKDVRAIPKKTGLSQSAFAALLGVSLRTLQELEQGLRTPTGPASALLRIADRHPRALVG